ERRRTANGEMQRARGRAWPMEYQRGGQSAKCSLIFKATSSGLRKTTQMRCNPAVRQAVLLVAVLFLAAAGTVGAQTIYPLNRAEILAGSHFDLKVEFPAAPPAAALRVTINGADATSVAGKAPTVVEHEDGGGYSAFWIRDMVLTQPGKYI